MSDILLISSISVAGIVWSNVTHVLVFGEAMEASQLLIDLVYTLTNRRLMVCKEKLFQFSLLILPLKMVPDFRWVTNAAFHERKDAADTTVRTPILIGDSKKMRGGLGMFPPLVEAENEWAVQFTTEGAGLCILGNEKVGIEDVQRIAVCLFAEKCLGADLREDGTVGVRNGLSANESREIEELRLAFSAKEVQNDASRWKLFLSNFTVK